MNTFSFIAVLEFESVGKEGIAIRGKSAARHVGIDSDGNLSSYVSINIFCKRHKMSCQVSLERVRQGFSVALVSLKYP